FGDPETQPILMRLQTDLLELLEAALQGRLDQVQAQWDPRAAMAVVLAAHGYPDAPRTGDPVVGLDAGLPADCKLFHAGTRLDQGRVRSAGGRVLAACALGEGVEGAARRAYAVAGQLGLDGGFYRSDIGHRAIARGD